MAEYDTFHIAVAPPATLRSELIEQLASILGKDLYGTRLLLSAKIPRIAAHHGNLQAAESTVQRLRALGLVAFMCADSELRRPSPSTLEAHSLRLADGEVTFLSKAGEQRTMKAADVFLILRGTKRIRTVEEVTRSKMKFSLPATVLTGGIPIWRRVKEKTQQTCIQNECFVRLYSRLSYEPTVEISQYGFDYSFLGTKMASSALINVSTTVAELRKIFPQAPFDDRLKEHGGVDAPFAEPGDEIEINCKLIYLYYQAVNRPGPFNLAKQNVWACPT